MSKQEEACILCGTSIEESQKEFAEDQTSHPGVLGLVHTECYSYMDDIDPSLPWTDPISGEVDFESMQEDLGASDGIEEESDNI